MGVIYVVMVDYSLGFINKLVTTDIHQAVEVYKRCEDANHDTKTIHKYYKHTPVIQVWSNGIHILDYCQANQLSEDILTHLTQVVNNLNR